MTEPLKKYLILERTGALSAMDALNNFYELGYKLKNIEREKEKHSDKFILTIELDTAGYDNVVEVRDAPQDEANKLLKLGEGWMIASTSISSKFYRMVKRDKPSDSGA